MDTYRIDCLLGSLNEHQQRAVAVGPGKAVVLGNPGSGKTRVLTARLARLARDGYSLSWCLAMTFTRAAAKEINDRLDALGLGAGRVGTLHSVCNEVLMGPGSELVDCLHLDETSWKTEMLLKRVLSVEKFKRYRYDLDEIRCYVEACKATGVCPVFGNPFGLNMEGHKRIEKLAVDWTDRTGMPAWALPLVYDELETMRAGNQLYGFDDMQLWAWQLLLTRSDVLGGLQARWPIVMIDEGQDSAPIQWDMTFLLANMGSRLTARVKPGEAAAQNLMVLGDVAQSLYGFRSASPEIFQKFCGEDDVGVYSLPVNYRSVPEICQIGSKLITGEEWHLGGDMVHGGMSMPDALGGAEPVAVHRHAELGEEARWVVKEIVADKEKTGSWRSCAVLSRLSTFINIVEIECIRLGIPYEKRASGTFAGGKEVTGLIGYLRVAGGWDTDGSWERAVVNTPFRYIGKKALYAADLAHTGGPGYLSALMRAGGLSLRQRREIARLQEVLADLRARMEDEWLPKKLIKWILAATEFEDALRRESGGLSPDAAKMAALQQVEWLAGLFTTARDFVIFMDQMNESVKLGRKRLETKDTSVDALVISTIHRAKGLEWPIVYMCDVTQGRHPWSRAHSLDEELRLAYVGVTRAMHKCVVSYSGSPETTKESFIVTRVKQALLDVRGITTP